MEITIDDAIATLDGIWTTTGGEAFAMARAIARLFEMSESEVYKRLRERQWCRSMARKYIDRVVD